MEVAADGGFDALDEQGDQGCFLAVRKETSGEEMYCLQKQADVLVALHLAGDA